MLKKTWYALIAIAVIAGVPIGATAQTIKVGVLHSLSGTMAISETTLKDTILMMVDDQNKKGGLLGIDFLKHFNWTFDYPDGKLILTPNKVK